MAPTVFAAYTRDVMRATDASAETGPDAAASAKGNVAPSATVIGSRSNATLAACDTTRRPNTMLGSATCCAMTSGIRVAANHAAATADTALTRSIAASHVAGLEVRRAMRVAAADPIASPLMNAAAIVANA